MQDAVGALLMATDTYSQSGTPPVEVEIQTFSGVQDYDCESKERWIMFTNQFTKCMGLDIQVGDRDVLGVVERDLVLPLCSQILPDSDPNKRRPYQAIAK